MPTTVANKKYFTFVAGLNTEAGPLTYPPNSWKEGTNIVPQIDGSVVKRKAVDYESGFQLHGTPFSLTSENNDAFTLHEWKAAAGIGTLNFKVEQRGRFLVFYKDTVGSLSSNLGAYSVDLATFKVGSNPTPIGVDPITAVSTNGKLLVVSASTQPFLVEFDVEANTIHTENVTIEVRDLVGLDDGLAVNQRPIAEIVAHSYNLLNQGWTSPHIVTYFSAAGAYPSNAQVWTLGKNAADVFTPSVLDAQDFGSSPAPRGRFILDVFTHDRSAATGFSDIANQSTPYRPTTCAFYAGRAWYAGVNDLNLNSWVMFSQVALTSENYGRCYQEADPTSEVISDLVATDGGVIPIQDAGTIVKLLPFANSMLVFAHNGVWQITGDASGKFSATSYEVKRLTSVGCINQHSIVEAEQLVLFWGEDNIWAIRQDQVGSFVVESVSSNTIQTEYQAIPVASRFTCTGLYHLPSKTIYWLYNTAPATNGSKRFKKDKLLCLDLRLKAFYTLTVASLVSNSPYVVGMAQTEELSTQPESVDVVVGSNDVQVVGTDVTISSTSSVFGASRIKFLTIVPSASDATTTFSEFVTTTLYDWFTKNSVGVDYPSYIVTGDDLGEKQGGDKAIQGLYVISFMNRTETGVDANGNPTNTSGCIMQARWDWTDNAVANKWGPEQQIYRRRRVFNPAAPSATFNDGYPVVVAKSKIRGRGKSLSIRFSAQAGKPMELIGWSTTFLGNSNV